MRAEKGDAAQGRGTPDGHVLAIWHGPTSECEHLQYSRLEVQRVTCR